MPYLYTCRTCALPAKSCPTRATVAKALTALGVRSAKHACADFKPLFSAGDPVIVETRAWLTSRSGSYEEQENEPPILKYRGHFIRYVGSKAIVFVKPGTESENGTFRYQLESPNGFIKAPVSRVWPSDWAPVLDTTECRQCGSMPAAGQPCGRDPVYGPACPLHTPSPPTDGPKGQDGQEGGGSPIQQSAAPGDRLADERQRVLSPNSTLKP
ncbi:hypothetical protein [Caulobacter segnis]